MAVLPPQLAAPMPLARLTAPQSVPWTPSITQPAKTLAHRAVIHPFSLEGEAPARFPFL